MVNGIDPGIFSAPLTELTPAELHQRGLVRLDQSLERPDAADQSALAAQAMALFFASVSAAGQAGAGGSHRPGTAPEDRTLGERVRGG
jgi:hypothetical protein